MPSLHQYLSRIEAQDRASERAVERAEEAVKYEELEGCQALSDAPDAHRLFTADCPSCRRIYDAYVEGLTEDYLRGDRYAEGV